MIRITFKNVGQGDTILLEWEKSGLKKIGVIDCNKTPNTPSVLDYIISKNYKRIEFLLLTHPHTDHFSGFYSLIHYCLENNIQVGYFLHTSNFSKEFWKMAVNNAEAINESMRLFQIVREARQKMAMKVHSIQGDSPFPPMGIGDYFLKILAPTSNELDKFVNATIISSNPNEEENGNLPSANYLSTLIKIYSNEDWFALLTSDVNSDVLLSFGLDKKETKELSGTLVLGQSPHHGSKANQKNSFWKNLKRKENVPIVFSVGKNNYGHPAKEVVDFFTKHKFKLYSTNPVGAFMEKTTEEAKKVISHMDTFSKRISKKNNDFEGDKTFEIDLQGNVVKV